MMTPVELGPFDLHAPVGKGGMGEVWRATHRAEGVDVAIKVMTAAKALEERFHTAFRGEVRAVASLEHAGIIRVFDCGEVSQAAARATGGHLVEGSSYLAMELAVSTLKEIDRKHLDWWQQRTILLRILDALSHAHARGVIHRDLKPENVLVVPANEGPQLKLSDFGLAHALDRSDQTEITEQSVSGTPRFMSPEQIMGQWRDQGPWTDLYAVGCLAYWLTSSGPPFSSEHTEQILRSHLFEPIPPLIPNNVVAQGFEAWVGRLLSKQPIERYRFAADAIHDLMNLPDPSQISPGRELRFPVWHGLDGPSSGEFAPGFDSTEIFELGAEMSATMILSKPSWEVGLQDSSTPFPESPGPPLPESWQTLEVPRPSIKMLGVGLGLYGLRQIPLIDREPQRDALWQALRDVRKTGCPRLIALRGPTGIGKSRLAEWMSERVHEVGAARVLKATHSPIPGPSDGLARMIANHLRCVGLSREIIVDRVRQFWAADNPLESEGLYECLAISELISPAADPDFDESQVRVRFSSPTERYIVLQRIFARLTSDRPLLICLDDVQWGSDALAMAEHLLTATQDLPVLMVLTVRDESLASRPVETEQLERLLTMEGVQELVVAPLEDHDHRDLIHHLLGLEDKLAGQVARRTAGNPLFAVQLVGDWVERGVLEVGAGGFCLRAGERAELPDDIHDLLTERISQLLSHVDDGITAGDAQIALELAAALGRDVDLREWTAVCANCDVDVPHAIVDAMVINRLAHAERQSWTFLHGALRESLQRLALEEGRWLEHHRICAQVLLKLHGSTRPGVSQRMGRHLLAAHAWQDALTPLLRGADEYRLTSDFRLAHALFELREYALHKLKRPHSDPGWIEGWVRRARTYIQQNLLEQATELLDRAEPLVQAHGPDKLLAELLYARALHARTRGDARAGMRYAQDAHNLSLAARDDLGVGNAIQMLGDLSYTGGAMEEARGFYTRALAYFQEPKNVNDLASCWLGLGNVHAAKGEFDAAGRHLMKAMTGFESVGNSYATANCLNSLGEVHRIQEDFATATAYYERALAMMQRLSVQNFVAIEFNMGLTLLAQGHYPRARTIFVKALKALSGTGRGGYVGVAHAVLVPCCAAAGDWPAWDLHLSQARTNLAEAAMADGDVAHAAEVAGRLAGAANQPERARQAYELALSQWQALQDEANVARVQQILDSF